MSDGLHVQCTQLDALTDVARALYYTTKVLKDINDLRRGRVPRLST